jgi:hypothetical protein
VEDKACCDAVILAFGREMDSPRFLHNNQRWETAQFQNYINSICELLKQAHPKQQQTVVERIVAEMERSTGSVAVNIDAVFHMLWRCSNRESQKKIAASFLDIIRTRESLWDVPFRSPWDKRLKEVGLEAELQELRQQIFVGELEGKIEETMQTLIKDLSDFFDSEPISSKQDLEQLIERLTEAIESLDSSTNKGREPKWKKQLSLDNLAKAYGNLLVHRLYIQVLSKKLKEIEPERKKGLFGLFL